MHKDNNSQKREARHRDACLRVLAGAKDKVENEQKRLGQKKRPI